MLRTLLILIDSLEDRNLTEILNMKLWKRFLKLPDSCYVKFFKPIACATRTLDYNYVHYVESSLAVMWQCLTHSYVIVGKL